MHMADALISPAVGATMWAATAGAAAYSVKKIQLEMDQKKVPLMGVMGAFIFTAQMINFSIPGTGSSGHLGGGLLLAVLLGPYAGFLTMASILAIQALFFADGGLLALGANIFNLGFFTCFVAYPFIYRKIIGRGGGPRRITIASVVAAVVGLQMGAFSVVLETLASGRTGLPLGAFVSLMQPIHLAIGVVEGLVTAAVIGFVWKARPELMERASMNRALGDLSIKKVLLGLAAGAVLTGAGLSWFASSHPDGLEWAMFKASGKEDLEATSPVHEKLAGMQEKTSILPDYGFKGPGAAGPAGDPKGKSWPAIDAGTTVSGLVGGLMTLLLAGLMGLMINQATKPKRNGL